MTQETKTVSSNVITGTNCSWYPELKNVFKIVTQDHKKFYKHVYNNIESKSPLFDI